MLLKLYHTFDDDFSLFKSMKVEFFFTFLTLNVMKLPCIIVSLFPFNFVFDSLSLSVSVSLYLSFGPPG